MASNILANIRPSGVRCLCTRAAPAINLKENKKRTFSKHLSEMVPWFQETLKNGPSNFYNESWQKCRNDLFETVSADENRVNYTILDICDFHKRPDAGRDYVKYLQSHDIPMSLSIVGKYLSMYHCRQSVTEEEEKEILEIYDNLRKKYPRLDSTTARRCIPALCLTKRWLEGAEELMEMIKITDKPVFQTYQSIICAAFKNLKPEIAWKYLHLLQPKSANEDIYFHHLTYMTKHLTKKSDFVSVVEDMFEYWHKYRIIPRWSHIELYIQHCNRFKWMGTVVDISNESMCNNCSGLLKMEIAEEEFFQLREAMMKENIVVNDPYARTTPKELNEFTQFIDRSKHYDIVIDALNIFYSGYFNKAEMNDWDLNMMRQQTLASVVKIFVEQKKKILVLGRKHLWRRKSAYLEYISKNALVYNVNDSSEDDPFMIYATMAKGLKTKFVSRDLMRQHKSLLVNSQLQTLFKQWQWTHQYRINFNRDNSEFELKEPSPFLSIPQKINNFWHIPFFVSDVPLDTEFHTPPSKWVCFQHLDNWRPSG